MERLNFNQLYYFYTVAREGSIKAASKKLHLTQPTISTQIKQLEDEVGFKVFDRKHRKLELNERGKFLLKRAEKLFMMADEIVSSLPKKGKASRTRISIGALSSLSNSFIYDFSLKLWKNKSISVSISQGSQSELIDKLNKDEIQMILSDSSYRQSQRHKATNLGHDRIVVVGAPEMKSLKKNFPKSLNDQPYLSFSRQGRLQEDINYFFERNGIQPEVIGEVEDVTLMRVITEDGSAFSIMPYRAAKESIKQGNLVVIGDLDQVKSNLWLVTSVSGSHRVLIKKIINDYFLRHKS